VAFDFRNLQFTFRNSRRQSRRFPDCKIVNKIKHRLESPLLWKNLHKLQATFFVEQDFPEDSLHVYDTIRKPSKMQKSRTANQSRGEDNSSNQTVQ